MNTKVNMMYGFSGNRWNREEFGGMGRAKPAPYPHIFPSITATPREPMYELPLNTQDKITMGG